MPSRTLPGLGLKGDWDLGEDLYKDEMDVNLRVLSVVAGQQVLEIVAAEPGAPAEGDIVILDETHATHANEIAVYDEAAWRYIVPIEGMQMYNLDDGERYTFDGAEWAVPVAGATPTESIMIACSDETTAITVGAGKTTFRMPYAFTLTDVRASVGTAPTGSGITIDVNEGGVTLLSTKCTIDATEKTSQTGAVAEVIADATLADDAEITIDFDVVGSTIAGAGVKVYLIGHQ
jgi:hypothetical protein